MIRSPGTAIALALATAACTGDAITAPTAGPVPQSILLRGPGTVSASAREPIYIVDGVVRPPEYIGTIAIEEIVQIEVLKVCTPTVLYETDPLRRGTIFITTTRGAPPPEPAEPAPGGG